MTLNETGSKTLESFVNGINLEKHMNRTIKLKELTSDINVEYSCCSFDSSDPDKKRTSNMKYQNDLDHESDNPQPIIVPTMPELQQLQVSNEFKSDSNSMSSSSSDSDSLLILTSPYAGTAEKIFRKVEVLSTSTKGGVGALATIPGEEFDNSTVISTGSNNSTIDILQSCCPNCHRPVQLRKVYDRSDDIIKVKEILNKETQLTEKIQKNQRLQQIQDVNHNVTKKSDSLNVIEYNDMTDSSDSDSDARAGPRLKKKKTSPKNKTSTAITVPKSEQLILDTELEYNHLFNKPKNPILGPKYCYTICLWGQNLKYVQGAIVLGQSIRDFSPKVRSGEIDMVCLLTADVPSRNREMLQKVGWEIREICHIGGIADNLFTWKRSDYPEGHRFDNVFTKLRAFEVLDKLYDKFLLLDIDMLVLSEGLDDLFEFPAPAAMLTGQQDWGHGVKADQLYFFSGPAERKTHKWQKKLLPDVQKPDSDSALDSNNGSDQQEYVWEKVPIEQNWGAPPESSNKNSQSGKSNDDATSRTWGRTSGINAGLMLLQPNKRHFQAMVTQIQDHNHPEHIPGNGPEQDFLTRFFADRWTSIDKVYNFQLHQMWYAVAPKLTHTLRARMLIESAEEVGEGGEKYNSNALSRALKNIKVMHYSGEKKPWDFLSKDLIPGRDADAEANRAEEIEKSCEEFTGYTLWIKQCKNSWQRLHDCKHWTISEYKYKDGQIYYAPESSRNSDWDSSESDPELKLAQVDPLVRRGAMAILRQAYKEWFAVYEKCLRMGYFPAVQLDAKKKEKSSSPDLLSTTATSLESDCESPNSQNDSKVTDPMSSLSIQNQNLLKLKLIQHREGWESSKHNENNKNRSSVWIQLERSQSGFSGFHASSESSDSVQPGSKDSPIALGSAFMEVNPKKQIMSFKCNDELMVFDAKKFPLVMVFTHAQIVVGKSNRKSEILGDNSDSQFIKPKVNGLARVIATKYAATEITDTAVATSVPNRELKDKLDNELLGSYMNNETSESASNCDVKDIVLYESDEIEVRVGRFDVTATDKTNVIEQKSDNGKNGNESDTTAEASSVLCATAICFRDAAAVVNFQKKMEFSKLWRQTLDSAIFVGMLNDINTTNVDGKTTADSATAKLASTGPESDKNSNSSVSVPEALVELLKVSASLQYPTELDPNIGKVIAGPISESEHQNHKAVHVGCVAEKFKGNRSYNGRTTSTKTYPFTISVREDLDAVLV